MTGALWLAVVAIGAVTYLTRALPFVLPQRRRGRGRAPAWLDALGPCILAAMAVAVLLPEGRAAVAGGQGTPFIAGLAAAAMSMGLRRDAGLATVAGIAGYALAQWLAG